MASAEAEAKRDAVRRGGIYRTQNFLDNSVRHPEISMPTHFLQTGSGTIVRTSERSHDARHSFMIRRESRDPNEGADEAAERRADRQTN